MIWRRRTLGFKQTGEIRYIIDPQLSDCRAGQPMTAVTPA